MARVALFASALTLLSTTASAHIALDSPPVRDAEMKTAPCGGATLPGATPGAVTTFRPGQTVTVRWHETVEHPGFFRIAFSADGNTFPSDPVDPPVAVAFPVLTIIPKVAGVTSYSADITLPDMECAGCALQVIQYMEQHPPPPYYYQCADIVLSSSATGSGGSGGSGAAGAAGSSAAAAAPDSMNDMGCGCRLATRSAAGGLAVALGCALGALLARRRRARRA